MRQQQEFAVQGSAEHLHAKAAESLASSQRYYTEAKGLASRGEALLAVGIAALVIGATLFGAAVAITWL